MACADGEAKFPLMTLRLNWRRTTISHGNNFARCEAIIEVPLRCAPCRIVAQTSPADVTNISSRCDSELTCRVDVEHFLPFEQNRWFKDAQVAKVLNVKESTP